MASVRGGIGSSNRRAGLAESETSFNRYANYLLYGSTADSLSGDYSDYTTYKLDEEIASSQEENDNYWEQASNLLSVAKERFANTKLDNEAEEDIYLFIGDQQEILSFLRAYRQSTIPDQTTLMRRYLSSGAKVADSYITESLKPLYELNSELANNYLKIKNNEYAAGFALLDAYRENGCIKSDNSIDEVCVKRLFDLPTQEYDDLSNNALKLRQDSELFIKNKTRQIERECWTISDKLLALTHGNNQ